MTSEQDFPHAIARLHAAMGKLMTGDASPIKALHSHAAEVTSFYGMGGYEKGWEAVSKRWDWAAANLFRGGGAKTVTYENLSSGVSGDLGYTVDIEHHVGENGETRRSLRVTHIFRREGGEWRLVHRHGNPLEQGPAVQP